VGVAVASVVGWAKARSAVPTRSNQTRSNQKTESDVGTLRFAHLTALGPVGWVERSETHRDFARLERTHGGFRLRLNPPYGDLRRQVRDNCVEQGEAVGGDSEAAVGCRLDEAVRRELGDLLFRERSAGERGEAREVDTLGEP
jgi:hypothetical protein